MAGWTGSCDPAFAAVADAFAAAIADGTERGALCVMAADRVLVDIRGGTAAHGRVWAEDTLACCFSVRKGVLSLLAHVMIARGLLQLETRVAALWPAFAAQGKGTITVHDVLTHRAGLPAVSGQVERGDLYDWARMIGHLEGSAPVVPPQDVPVYHNMTYGHLLGEVLCRAAGVSHLPTLLHQMVTGPLGADFRIGLQAQDIARCATLTQDDPTALFLAVKDEPATLFARSMAFFAEGEDFNSDPWRCAVVGSGSGHATAQAIARLYGQLVWPGGLLPRATQIALRREQCRNPADPILGLPVRYGLGFELSLPPGLDFGPNPQAVGHWGAGGAQGFADPDTGLSFGYVTGHMSGAMGSSVRGRAYVAALYDCL